MGSFPPTQDQLTIQTGGQTLAGWLTSTVTRGVELCPSHYEVTLTERYPGSATEAVVVPGSSAKIYLGSDLVLNGWIDQYWPSIDGQTHNVRISGRSLCEDVVDVSYLGPPWQVTAASLKAAVTQILKQVNVGLTMSDADDVSLTGPYLPPLAITPGETIYQVIETLCRMCARLVWDDGSGNLVISQVGTARAANSLVEGSNIEAGAVRVAWDQRYYQIVISNSGQAYELGSMSGYKPGSATDDQIRQNRTKLILMDGSLGPGDSIAKKRAQWEVNRRIGRSLIAQITTTGWRDSAGALYIPNTIIHVTSPTLKVDSDLIIAEATWERGEQGTKSILTCMPAQALTPEPFAPTWQLGVGPGTPSGGAGQP